MHIRQHRNQTGAGAGTGTKRSAAAFVVTFGGQLLETFCITSAIDVFTPSDEHGNDAATHGGHLQVALLWEKAA